MARKKPLAAAGPPAANYDAEDVVARQIRLQAAQAKVDNLDELVTDLKRQLNAARSDLKHAKWDRDHWLRNLAPKYARRIRIIQNGQQPGEDAAK